jgi:hypothetical protein
MLKADDAVKSKLELSKQREAMYYDIVKSLIGARNFDGNRFPIPVDTASCKQIWRSLMVNIRKAIGLQDKEPEHLPSVESTGLLVHTVEDITNGHIPEDELESVIELLHEHLQSPYAVQTLMGALFCRWVFQAPEPMCEGQHSEMLLQDYEHIKALGACATDTSPASFTC